MVVLLSILRELKDMRYFIGILGLATVPSSALADGLDSGDTAWLLTATALVLFMTIPGLALFYSGLVRAKNTLSVLMQCFAICLLYTSDAADE